MGDGKEARSAGSRGSSSGGSSSGGSEDLQVLNLRDHYDVERELGRGTYGKVVLASCRHTRTRVALKLLPKTSTKLREFQREFQLSYFLSPHASIVDTYNVAFQTRSSYVFAQEHAPLGDLFDAIPAQLGMRETHAKSVIKQLASALDFMHSKKLVHRDIKPENVLVMAADFSRVKLLDFGMTRKHGSMVRKNSGSIPYTPPEVCEAVRNENVHVSKSADVWALAVLLFCMLTGNFPWENADIGDMYYNEFVLWQRRKTTKLPSQWRRFTPRLMKLFRKALEIKPERRCGVGETYKYMAHDWTQKPRVTDSEEDSGSSASGGHMDELAIMLKDHGIDTRVDRRLRERRISEWLLSL
ncbi:hypothetical protein ACOMHN_054268 [Nucella lapillus]